jgi:glutamate-1-semialdehyde 2,1-aminomutase
VSAALATLTILQREPVYKTIQQRGQMLMSGLGEILTDAGLPHVLLGVPAMFGLGMGITTATDYRSFHAADHHLYEKITTAMAEHGPLPELDDREPWFLSYSHSEKDIADTLEAFEEAVRKVKGHPGHQGLPWSGEGSG